MNNLSTRTHVRPSVTSLVGKCFAVNHWLTFSTVITTEKSPVSCFCLVFCYATITQIHTCGYLSVRGSGDKYIVCLGKYDRLCKRHTWRHSVHWCLTFTTLRFFRSPSVTGGKLIWFFRMGFLCYITFWCQVVWRWWYHRRRVTDRGQRTILGTSSYLFSSVTTMKTVDYSLMSPCWRRRSHVEMTI